jgi:aquaporin Z
MNGVARTGVAGSGFDRSMATRSGAELLGTFLLVFVGAGSAVAGRVQGGVVAVAMTFGLVLLALVYAIGPVSGCHINPAVTLGMLLAGRASVLQAVYYWIAQLLGAIVAAFGLWVLTKSGGVNDETTALATNGYGPHINLGGTIILETVLTFVLVLVVLLVSARTELAGVAGLVIGATLAATNLIAIPLDGASINPARSFGPALFAGGTALSQLWVFLVFPLLGGLLAAAALPLFPGSAGAGRLKLRRSAG